MCSSANSYLDPLGWHVCPGDPGRPRDALAVVSACWGQECNDSSATSLSSPHWHPEAKNVK